MKKILYFVLAVLTIIYIGFLCYANLLGMSHLPEWLHYLAIYGGLVIALLYAAINFFGNPLKIVFFILLILMTVVLVLTIAIPDTFRSLFKMGEPVEEMIRALNW